MMTSIETICCLSKVNLNGMCWYDVLRTVFQGREHDLFISSAKYFPFPLVIGSTDPDEVDGEDTSITGLIIQNMRLRNAAEECLRIKYWVTNSVIQSNDIRFCGIHDYELGGGDSNGEGICELFLVCKRVHLHIVDGKKRCNILCMFVSF